MLFERMMRAARLDVNLYEEVEADQGATSQAATVVGIAAIAGAIGAAITATQQQGGGAGTAVLAVVLAIIGAFLGAVIGAVLFGFLVHGFDVPSRDDVNLLTALEAVPGACLGIAAVYAIGLRGEAAHAH